MRSFALTFFRLERTGEDGVSARIKLEKVEEVTGKRPMALDGPGIPAAAFGAWSSWSELNSGRCSNGMALSGLSWLEIDAWSRIVGSVPGFCELDLIRVIDRAFVEVFSSADRGKNGG